MIEFEKSESLIRMIEQEKMKYYKPTFFDGNFDIKGGHDDISDRIRQIAGKIEKECELYLICDMAEKWVEDQKPKDVIYQSMIPINPRTKKNSQQILINRKSKKPFVTQSDIYKQYEKDAGWFLKPLQSPIAEPVNVKCVFYRDSARRVDLTNLLEAMDDILVKYKILEDDNCNIIVSHDGSRVMIDRINPRTEIEITLLRTYN